MRSNELSVKLVKYFSEPVRNIASAAKTCYSSRGIVQDDSIVFPKDENLITDLLKAGHHTTFEHQYFQFAISNVSRYAVWSLLHSHPFYNSEQVSQRYTKVIPDYNYLPELNGNAAEIYSDTLKLQYQFYEELSSLLIEPVKEFYFEKFPARKKLSVKYNADIEKKCREIARYILPIGTFTYLYHTINTITILRYYKSARLNNLTPEENNLVALMVDEVKKVDHHFEKIINEIDSQTKFLNNSEFLIPRDFITNFDSELSGYSSKLADYGINAERTLADSVRMYLGRNLFQMDDKTAIEYVLNPGINNTMSSDIVLTNNLPLTKALNHIRYTFKKKLSHAADSQNQRHRTIPSSSFSLTNMDLSIPDYITPKLIGIDPKIEKRYSEMMEILWSKINSLIKIGIYQKTIVYLLPNAVTVRLIESGNLLNYHHKYAMRLCYNAQEEIWQNAVDEVKQIMEVHPNIGVYLLPPCSIRQLAGQTPVCPEGKRYCGVKVWKLRINEYNRTI